MTATEWATLIPAIAGVLSGVGALLHSMATRRIVTKQTQAPKS